MTTSTPPRCTRADWLPVFPDDVEAIVTARWRDQGLIRRDVVEASHAPQVAVEPGAGTLTLTEDTEDVAPELPDFDLGWLDELRTEHLELLEAWERAATAVADARSRFAGEQETYRERLRDAARAGSDPGEVAVPPAPAVRRAQLEVLGEEEVRARRALGAFALRIIDRELVAHGEVLVVLAGLERGRRDQVAMRVARLAGPLSRLVQRGVYADAQNEREAVGRWLGELGLDGEPIG